jgi:hypothetical protein
MDWGAAPGLVGWMSDTRGEYDPGPGHIKSLYSWRSEKRLDLEIMEVKPRADTEPQVDASFTYDEFL